MKDDIISTPFKLNKNSCEQEVIPLAEQSRTRSFQTHRVEQLSDSDRTQQSLCCSITFSFFHFFCASVSMAEPVCDTPGSDMFVKTSSLQPPISTSHAESFSLSHSVFTPRHSSSPPPPLSPTSAGLISRPCA